MTELLTATENQAKQKIAIVKKHCEYCRKKGNPDITSETILKGWQEYLSNATRTTRKPSKVETRSLPLTVKNLPLKAPKTILQQKRGRPRKEGDVSRFTLWRRRKEIE